MKHLTQIARVLVGGLFIFSGLVKGIDPKGLAYKMQEFFEVWANMGYFPKLMAGLGHQSLGFSIAMITAEVILGLTLLLGWQKKITVSLLLALTLFFTFLTAFVLFSGKIKACGCFGDCIPLTPKETFTKDIVLLVLVLILLFGLKYIQPLFSKWISIVIIAVSLWAILFLQTFVRHHLPIKDCLPFKVGSNLIEKQKVPANAVMDSFTYKFIYEKNGIKKEYTMNDLPDSTWNFVSRDQKLVRPGSNNVAPIIDFSLTNLNGVDTTDALLESNKAYYLFFVQDHTGLGKDYTADINYLSNRKDKNIPFFIVTSSIAFAKERYKNMYDDIFTCDATAIKTAARSKVTLYKMNGAIVEKKWGMMELGE